MRRETLVERTLRLQYAAWLSETKRQAKLAARPDVDARRVAAEVKRARRKERQRFEADTRQQGLASARWLMGAHW